MRYWMVTLMLGVSASTFAEMSIEDDGKALHVKDDGRPVATYHYELVEPPKGVSERYRRMGYLHPLYGLDGEVLTQDFPLDHYHHRGVFYAWVDSLWDGKRIDVWALDGVRQVLHKINAHGLRDGKAFIDVEHDWVYDDAPDTPIMREHLRMTFHPADGDTQAIDFDFTLTNVSDKEMVLKGATTDNKGYSGFNFRPDARKKPMHFTSAKGREPDDVLELDSQWADVTFSNGEKGRARKMVGVAMFEHPDNPEPRDGWILRHYGFLGQSWPHRTPYPMAPGDSVNLKHRLLVHRGRADEAGVAEAFEAYVNAAR